MSESRPLPNAIVDVIRETTERLVQGECPSNSLLRNSFLWNSGLCVAKLFPYFLIVGILSFDGVSVRHSFNKQCDVEMQFGKYD